MLTHSCDAPRCVDQLTKMRCSFTWSIACWLFGVLVFVSWPAPTDSLDCKDVPCSAPYTQTPVGSPCGCVLPIQVALELDVALDAFLSQVSLLTKEVASGTLLLQSQAKIAGVNAYSQDQRKTVVEIDLVPLGKAFDNLTVLMIFQRFRHHEVLSRESDFGNYRLVSIRYSGTTAFSYPSATPFGGLPGAGSYPHEKPFSVNVAKKEKNFGGSTITVILVLSISVAAALFGAVFFLFLKLTNRVTALGTLPKINHTIGCKSLGAAFSLSSKHKSPLFLPTVAKVCVSARTFALHELKRATDNFDTKRILGQGGFGQVFCGKLEDGSNIAVKLINRDDQRRAKEFKAEVEMLSRLHHRNLVKLIGVCLEDHHQCLVYELVSNGSVEYHLHGKKKDGLPLDWNTRLKIALGAARGLAYLHEDANPRVIHRDFKASNILLEEDFTPKISDFGLAKAGPEEENGHISTTVMGTFGYVAPEYAMTGHLLVKSDVYSYGVVLLELLSGRKPIDLTQPSGDENLVNWARPHLSSKEGLQKLVDPTLKGRAAFNSFARVAAVASMCVQPDASHRLFMGEVVQALKVVCNCADGTCSITVSPQNSAGGSDAAEYLTPYLTVESCERMNSTTSDSFISVDYDSGTAGIINRESSWLHETSSFTGSSSADSEYLLQQANVSFRRHSNAGSSKLAGIKSARSTEKEYVYATMSEGRLMQPCRLFCGTI